MASSQVYGSSKASCDFCVRRRLRCVEGKDGCRTCQLKGLTCTTTTADASAPVPGSSLAPPPTSVARPPSPPPYDDTCPVSDELLALLMPRSGELTLREAFLFCKALSYRPIPESDFLKDNLYHVLYVIEYAPFRFLVNTLAAKHLFDCGVELDEAVAYFDYAVAGFAVMNTEYQPFVTQTLLLLVKVEDMKNRISAQQNNHFQLQESSQPSLS